MKIIVRNKKIIESRYGARKTENEGRKFLKPI